MNISRSVAAVLVALAAATGVAATAGTAQAANGSRIVKCSAGGFTGYIFFNYTKRPSSSTIERIEYKIEKGSNKGGNEADVSWADGGTLPSTYFKTNKGIQDGNWHYLGGNYHRGTGGLGAAFVFDKSNANDPSCNINIGNP